MSEETLRKIHEAVAECLLNKIKSGQAVPADISNAIKFLKDNNINCDGEHNPVMKDMAEELPTDEQLEDMLS